MHPSARTLRVCQNPTSDSDLHPAILLVLVLLHRYGNLSLMPRYFAHALAPLAPKRKQGHYTRWRPPGARLVSIVMAYVTRTSQGLPNLELSAPHEPA